MSNSVKHLEIESEYEGQRIDNFLLTQLKGAPKSLIYRILRRGEVRVNKGRVKPPYRLKTGDLLRIPPIRLPDTSQHNQPPRKLQALISSAIIYQDDDLLVINKPSGIAVHGGSGIDFGVIEVLRSLDQHNKHYAPKEVPLRYELIHRLDRETSGCLLVAKRRAILRIVQDQFRQHSIDKRYLALLRGKLPKSGINVSAALKKNELSSGERIVKVNQHGKSAYSKFTPQQEFKLTNKSIATLSEVKITTGRTHQIRVHAAHTGHPIAGDSKYGDREFNKTVKRVTGSSRLFLHAHSISITHPTSNKKINFTSPLPEELNVTKLLA